MEGRGPDYVDRNFRGATTMNGRMEIREILGMLGTLAALSLAASAIETVGTEMAHGREVPAAVRVTPPEAPGEVEVAPPDAVPELSTEEARLVRPEVTPPPLRCPPLPMPGLRERLPGCRTVFA
jgi:hypothetical protein